MYTWNSKIPFRSSSIDWKDLFPIIIIQTENFVVFDMTFDANYAKYIISITINIKLFICMNSLMHIFSLNIPRKLSLAIMWSEWSLPDNYQACKIMTQYFHTLLLHCKSLFKSLVKLESNTDCLRHLEGRHSLLHSESLLTISLESFVINFFRLFDS